MARQRAAIPRGGQPVAGSVAPSPPIAVERALSDAGLPASALELELTESSLIADTEQVLATLASLKALGIKLSIDDFGTGYSSLAYLRRLPVDILKIDQSFVRGMISAADGHAIVEAIIHMARSLGLDTLAEGIEDQLTADELLRLGCHLGQGYLLARPAPPRPFPRCCTSAARNAASPPEAAPQESAVDASEGRHLASSLAPHRRLDFGRIRVAARTQ
jgi:EAL domain-containing protein (putative c-di-GMP-specific phosphodiesterase class I)